MLKDILERPYLWLSQCWIWIWQALMPQVFVAGSVESSYHQAVQNCWIASFLATCAILLILAARFRCGRKLLPRKAAVALMAACLSAGAFMLVFASAPEPPSDAAARIALTLFVVLAGIGQALTFREQGRLFSSLGAKIYAVHSVAAALAGTFFVMALSFCPKPLIAAASIASPLAGAAFYLSAIRRESPQTAAIKTRTPAKLTVPIKLSLTLLVPNLAFGAVQSYFFVGQYATWPMLISLSTVVAYVLFFVSAVILSADFRTLAYEVGFGIMALGCLLQYLFGFDSLVGYPVLSMGFVCVSSVVSTLSIHIIHTRRIPADWLMCVSMAFCSGGRLLGHLAGRTLQSDAECLLIVLSAILLASALFLSNRNSLTEGWGVESLSEGFAIGDACAKLGDAFGLSAREREVLERLVQGYSQKKIAAQLFVSEETVKTHLKHIYQKAGVHSGKELTNALLLSLASSRKSSAYNPFDE